jgi:hypothetical protein
MASVGIIAENSEFRCMMDHDEGVIRIVQEAEFHAVLDMYLGSDAPTANISGGRTGFVWHVYAPKIHR